MDEQRLDGNAAAGTLGEVFSFEVTTAGYACAGCGGTDRSGGGLRGEGAGASSAAPAAKTPLSGSPTTAGDTWSTSGGQDTSPPDGNAGG